MPKVEVAQTEIRKTILADHQLLLHCLDMQRHHVLSYGVECCSYMLKNNFIGQSAGVDKKALVRASKHTDKCYDNLIGQERIDRGVDYIIANKRSTVHELVSTSTGMYGNQTMVHIHKCTCYSKKKTISKLKTVILFPSIPVFSIT